MKSIAVVVPVAAVTLAVLFGAPSAASASSGTLIITSNTTLTEDHEGNILIESSNITLDCAHHTVLGPGDAGYYGGINVGFGQTGVTVKRCGVTGFVNNGIYAGGASGNRYEANVIYANANHGIQLEDGNNNVVVGNTISSNGAIGIVFTRSSQSRIENNTLQDNTNWAGVVLFDNSHDNIIADNTAVRNGQGFTLVDSTDNVVRGNTANLNRTHGFLVQSASHNVLDSNTSTRNLIGFGIENDSDSNTIRDNVANANTFEGFKFYSSDGNTCTSNAGNANGTIGFLVFGGSSFNALTENIGHGNKSVDASDDGSGTGNVWTGNNFGTTSGF